ncbi:MAG: hypothetical protein ACF8PN_10870 [Phycisphaerales bacterium]
MMVAAIAALSPAIECNAQVERWEGKFYYTLSDGPRRVRQARYVYEFNTITRDGTFEVERIRKVKNTPAADGIVQDQFGHLYIGGQNRREVYRIDASTCDRETQTTDDVRVFHIMLNPQQDRLWGCFWSPGSDLCEIPLNPFGPGVRRNVVGDDQEVTFIAWNAFDQNQESYYVYDASGGHFGTIDLSLAEPVTDKLIDGLHAAHSMAFDTYTGTFVTFGGEFIGQIDHHLPDEISFFDTRLELGIGALDQGVADGYGHVFVASGEGHVVFLDYSESGLIGAPRFAGADFLVDDLDDLAISDFNICDVTAK